MDSLAILFLDFAFFVPTLLFMGLQALDRARPTFP